MRISDWSSDVCSSDLISSDKLEREPYLQLLLEVHAGGSRILRQYTVLLDPPGMAPAKPAAVAPVPIAPSAAEPATPAPISAPAPRVSSEPAQSIFVEVDHPTPPPDERPIAPRSEPVKPGGKTQQPTSAAERSEEHTSELQSLMRSSYAVFCLKKKK